MAKTQFKIEPGKQEYFVTCEFDAPRELVFKVYTDPKMVPMWWGPRDLTTTVNHLEVKAGSVWRNVQVDAKGESYGFHGVIHEVKVPERVVQTFEFEGLPGHVSMETVCFEELPGNRTRVRQQSVFQSVADRDGMVASGMQSGVQDSMDRIEELLAKIGQHA